MFSLSLAVGARWMESKIQNGEAEVGVGDLERYGLFKTRVKSGLGRIEDAELSNFCNLGACESDERITC